MRLREYTITAAVALLCPTAYGWAEQYTVLQIGDAGSQAVAINSKQEVLVTTCDPAAPCTVSFWSEKTGLRAIPVQGPISGVQLNDRGEVAGVSANGIFFWSAKEGLRTIATPAGATVAGLNDHGELAGNITMGGATRAFVATERDGIVYLAPATAPANTAVSINDRGEVAGTMLVPCTGTNCLVALPQHAFLWTSKEGLRDLGILPSWQESIATDLDDRGGVAGYLTGPSNTHPFLWTERGGMQELGCPAKVCTRSLLAGKGVVVGLYVAGTMTRSFVWTEDAGIRDLGSLGGPTLVRATNDRGVAVGFSQLAAAAFHAFVWTEETGIVDLDPGHPTRVSNAYDVNDKDAIAGVLDGRAAIWTPKHGAH